jgi:hypothetical protein
MEMQAMVKLMTAAFADQIYNLFKEGRIQDARELRQQGIWRLMVVDLSMSEATASRLLSDAVRTLMEA